MDRKLKSQRSAISHADKNSAIKEFESINNFLPIKITYLEYEGDRGLLSTSFYEIDLDRILFPVEIARFDTLRKFLEFKIKDKNNQGGRPIEIPRELISKYWHELSRHPEYLRSSGSPFIKKIVSEMSIRLKKEIGQAYPLETIDKILRELRKKGF